jgi:hypothetical protein
MSAQLWRAYAGRGGKKPPETPAEAIRVLEEAGATRQEIAQFKRDLAEALGVSVRQIQRMTTESGRERRGMAKHKERLQAMAANHPKVRAASRSKRRASRMSNRGARLRIKASRGRRGTAAATTSGSARSSGTSGGSGARTPTSIFSANSESLDPA